VLQLSKNVSAICVWLLAILVSIGVAQVPSQQTPASPDRDRGIQLYQQGDANGAVEALRHAVQSNEKDGTAWHYLGLAYLLKGSKDDARKSFARAVAVREAALQPPAMAANATPDPASARQNRSERFQAVAESLEKYIELTRNPDPMLMEELDSLRWYGEYYGGTRQDEEIVTTKQATTRLRIVDKPPPNFSGTRAAGTGSLRAVFSADGTVKHILVIHKVDPEFDRACILAAKRIQFEPAVKDGRPVSMILEVEYGRYTY
jgi:tetratricopeptide (TPR) repeat protein